MYKRIDFTKTGGFPLTQDAMAFLQDGYEKMFGGIAQALGLYNILTGVTSAGGNVSNGWITINGEILPFVGCPVSQGSTVVVVETKDSVTYRDSGTNQVIVTRYATLGSGGVPIATFTTNTIDSLSAGIVNANNNAAAALSAANSAATAAVAALTAANNALSVANAANTTANNAASAGSTNTTAINTLTTNFNNQKNSTKIYNAGYMKFGRGSNSAGNPFPGNTDINPASYFGYGGSSLAIGPFPVDVNVFVDFNMLVETHDSGGQEYIYMRIVNTSNTNVLSEGYFRALVQNTGNGNGPDPDIANLSAFFTLTAGNSQVVNAIVNNYANVVNTPTYHGSQITAIVVPV